MWLHEIALCRKHEADLISGTSRNDDVAWVDVVRDTIYA